MSLPFAAAGRASGFNEVGDREYAWDQRGHSDAIAVQWPLVRRGRILGRVQYDRDSFGGIGSAVSLLAELAASSALGPAGTGVLFVGLLADALDLEQSVIPGTVGVALAGTALYIIGPSAMLPAFVVGVAIAETSVRQRRLNDHEVAFARKVFGERSLPIDRILLTDLVGIGNRPFTVPTLGGVILINIGQGFDDPTSYAGSGAAEKYVAADPGHTPQRFRAHGALFIHELTHAWQVANYTFATADYYCAATPTQIRHSLGPSQYRYGPADAPWGTLNPEQQASVVEDWFAGSAAPAGWDPDSMSWVPGTRQAQFRPMQADDGNPYYRYIRDHIRL